MTFCNCYSAECFVPGLNRCYKPCVLPKHSCKHTSLASNLTTHRATSKNQLHSLIHTSLTTGWGSFNTLAKLIKGTHCMYQHRGSACIRNSDSAHHSAVHQWLASHIAECDHLLVWQAVFEVAVGSGHTGRLAIASYGCTAVDEGGGSGTPSAPLWTGGSRRDWTGPG